MITIVLYYHKLCYGKVKIGAGAMKKFINFTIAAAVAALAAFNAESFVRYEDKNPRKIREIRITGFLDYAPFGYVDHPDSKVKGKFHTVYEPMIEKFKKENNLKIIYDLQRMDYEDLIQEVRSGEIDMVLGAYHDTELYKGLELVYPSIISNPVTIFMLPNRINEITDTESIKKLKGVRSEMETYSDFVEEQLQSYDIEKVKTPYEMFERLFTKKADYILVSQYFGLWEAARLGLRGQIAVARQTIWKMPLFIGVSKISPQRKLIIQKLTHFSEKPENRQMIEDNLIRMITEFESANKGVVPPTFGLEKE